SAILYPANGSIAKGSRRSSPTGPSAAAVCSEEMVAPIKTPWFQSRLSTTSGILVARRPPNKIASIGDPARSYHSSESVGAFVAETVNREFGCAAAVPLSGVQSLPNQSIRCAGGSLV